MDNKAMRILFKPFEVVSITLLPKTLLDLAREQGITMRADCGGIGICGKCLVKIITIDGELSPPTPSEISILGTEKIREGWRLSCQTHIVKGNAEIYVPSESLIKRYRSADIGLEKLLPLNPAIVFLRISPSKPSLSDVEPDFDRISAEIKRYGVDINPHDISLSILRILSTTIREANWDIDVVLWMDKLIDIRPHNNVFRPMGLAIDIGTSRIVIHLVDLVSGATLAVESELNPQVVYGADIISRLAYASKSDENLRKLQSLVINTINMMIKKISERASIPTDYMYEVIVTGNTVMHHLFLGIQPKYLGLAPYTPAIRGPLHFSSKELGLIINDNAIIYLPPIVAGFIGSDVIADCIIVDIDECKKPCILIDIGTNTEIVVNSGDRIVAGSTPAGPAFEGVTMSFGMRATEGAIDQVFMYYDKSIGDYVVRYSVIGDGKPTGICGSGYIDTIANLYRLGLINNRGKFVKHIKSSRLVSDKKYLGFIIARAEETSIGKDIIVNEKDIDSLLLAKAAIASGLKVLLSYTGLAINDVGKIFVAGSFGTYINIDNAIAIGLLPQLPASRYVFVGNTSISGTKAMLISREIREKAIRLSRSIEYIEIATYPEYRKIFTESLYLS